MSACFFVLFFLYQCKIEDVAIERFNTFRDLGITFDEKKSLSAHIKKITKAYSRLGFKKRTCHSFDDPYCLRSVYYD